MARYVVLRIEGGEFGHGRTSCLGAGSSNDVTKIFLKEYNKYLEEDKDNLISEYVQNKYSDDLYKAFDGHTYDHEKQEQEKKKEIRSNDN